MRLSSSERHRGGPPPGAGAEHLLALLGIQLRSAYLLEGRDFLEQVLREREELETSARAWALSALGGILAMLRDLGAKCRCLRRRTRAGPQARGCRVYHHRPLDAPPPPDHAGRLQRCARDCGGSRPLARHTGTP